MAEVQDIRKIQEVFQQMQSGGTDSVEKPKTKKEKKKERLKKQAATTTLSRKNKSPRYNKQYAKFVTLENPTIDQAIETIVSNANANFTEAIELHVNLGIDPRNSEQRVRFTTSLPHGIGKTVKILVIGNESKDEGNIIYRDSSAIPAILDGKLQPGKDFDMVITSPEMMKDLAKVARVLGPKGMMPSPKNGTVTSKLSATLEEFSKGQIEIKSQPNHAVIHQVVGNISFDKQKIVENIEHLITDLKKRQPSKLKKSFIQSIYVASTMGPSIKVNFE